MEGQGGPAGVPPTGTPGPGVVPAAKKRRKVLPTSLLIVGAFFFLTGAAMTVTTAIMTAPVVPPGTPTQVMSLPVLDDPAGLTSDGMIAYSNDAYGFDITFGEANVDPPTQPGDTPFLQSIDADWYATDAHMSVDGSDTGAVEPANTSADWGSSLPDNAERTFTPVLHASLPITGDELHKSLAVVAEMTVHVPYKVGSSSFSIAGSTVRRSVTLFVVSPAEMALRKSVEAWNSRAETNSSGLVAIGFGAVLAIVGFWLLRKDRAAA
jgi:hypothetical protein